MASIDILLAVMAALVAACFTGYSLTDAPRTTSSDQHERLPTARLHPGGEIGGAGERTAAGVLPRQGFARRLEGEQLSQPGHRGPADDERLGCVGKLKQRPAPLEPADRAERTKIDDERPADARKSPRRKLLTEIAEQAFDEERISARAMDE